ncbi:DNA-binding transcriptional LysR family regulator [Curtobacterium sp. PhB130]|uniref:LysR family transcriptional regulator n=1 Tax=unclassified Curtobacterium TaxID=257496 RepID=UPI000F4C271F|nr:MULTISPECIES: LysR family transcriptional regulator [unclassified Curtobacterium]ROS78159.1 DNA-binding transcriptional LysR family regulator [Curtobacterium sp. PhB130]TCK65522.1 DNA-binding transcriptional LysR family regulator [Curtobacterium sp. PhB136]
MEIIDRVDDGFMETRLLEQFVTVATEGSVTRAAERLWAAQSTVSAGIASLERTFGVRLFDRTGRHLVLTAVGEDLLPHARAVLATIDRMQDLATTDDADLRGRVRLGIFTSMDIVDLTGVLRTFSDRHPLVTVELRTSPSGTTGLVQDLAAGRLDLAYSGLPSLPAGIVVEPLREMPFRVFLAADHPLAGRASLSLSELADESFIDTAHGFGNRIILDQALERLGIRRRIVAEMNDMPAVIRFATAGLGVGVVPDSGVEHDGVAIDLVDEVTPLRVGLAMRADVEPNRAVRALARDIVAARR